MKKIVVFLAVLLIFANAALADGPMVRATGKLFGFNIDPSVTPGKAHGILAESGANCVLIDFSWVEAEKSPGSGKYDFSAFDKNPLLKLAQIKIVSIRLTNPAAEDIRKKDPQKYWKLVESFVTALVKHCGNKGIDHFYAPGDELLSKERADWTVAYGAMLPHIFKPMKAVSDQNLLFAGSVKLANQQNIQELYDAGIQPYFDILTVRVAESDPKDGIDMRSITSACSVMRANGDDNKQIFVVQGWGISKRSSQSDADALLEQAENGLRNLLTLREEYNPAWLLGGLFNLSGLDDQNKIPTDFVKAFPPIVPRSSLDIKIDRDIASGVLLTGQSYPVKLEFANFAEGNVEIKDISLIARNIDGVSIERKSEKKGAIIIPQEAVKAEFVVTPSDSVSSKDLLLVGEAIFSFKGRNYRTDAWTSSRLASRIEVNILPKQVELTSDGKEVTVGMSIINHSSEPFKGTVELKCPQGIVVEQNTKEVEVQSLGLEAAVFKLRAAGIAAGKYQVQAFVGEVLTELTVEVK